MRASRSVGISAYHSRAISASQTRVVRVSSSSSCGIARRVPRCWRRWPGNRGSARPICGPPRMRACPNPRWDLPRSAPEVGSSASLLRQPETTPAVYPSPHALQKRVAQWARLRLYKEVAGYRGERVHHLVPVTCNLSPATRPQRTQYFSSASMSNSQPRPGLSGTMAKPSSNWIPSTTRSSWRVQEPTKSLPNTQLRAAAAACR